MDYVGHGNIPNMFPLNLIGKRQTTAFDDNYLTFHILAPATGLGADISAIAEAIAGFVGASID